MNCHSTVGGSTHVELHRVGSHLARLTKCGERVLPLDLGGTSVRYYLNFSHNALIITEFFYWLRNTSMNFARRIVCCDSRS